MALTPQCRTCWLMMCMYLLGPSALVNSVHLGYGVSSRNQLIYSYTVLISYSTFDTRIARSQFGYCAGAIIDPHWILTAASCVMTNDLPVIELYIDYHSYSGPRHKIYSNQSIIIPYPTFAEMPDGQFKDDIALIKLPPDEMIDLNQERGPRRIKLPERVGFESKFINKRCSVAGFGETAGTAPSETLSVGDVQISGENRDCSPRSPNDTTPSVCVIPGPNGTYPCHYDAGGPLSCKLTDGEHYLTGIIPPNSNDCTRGAPPPMLARFPAVSQYLNWIADVNYFHRQIIDDIKMHSTLSRVKGEGDGQDKRDFPDGERLLTLRRATIAKDPLSRTDNSTADMERVFTGVTEDPGATTAGARKGYSRPSDPEAEPATTAKAVTNESSTSSMLNSTQISTGPNVTQSESNTNTSQGTAMSSTEIYLVRETRADPNRNDPTNVTADTGNFTLTEIFASSPSSDEESNTVPGDSV